MITVKMCKRSIKPSVPLCWKPLLYTVCTFVLFFKWPQDLRETYTLLVSFQFVFWSVRWFSQDLLHHYMYVYIVSWMLWIRLHCMALTSQSITALITWRKEGIEKGSGQCSFLQVGNYLCLFVVGCLVSQQHASVSQGRICSDNFVCCHTDIEVADQTFHLTQSQYTDIGPTSPIADPITPGAWQGSYWSADLKSLVWLDPEKIPVQAGFEPDIFRSRGGRLTARPKSRSITCVHTDQYCYCFEGNF